MAIQIYCEACRTANKQDAEKCKKCGATFGRDKTYRIDVTLKGKRITRMAPNLTLAREIESSTKADLLRGEYDITHHKAKKKPLTMAELWEKYLPWAKQNKKSWIDDVRYYRKHLEKRFGTKPLEEISAFDLEKLKGGMKKSVSVRGRPYAAQTIKHVLVIVRRLYNLARKWGLYEGENPASKVQMPRIDNQVTEYLTNEELSRLLAVLDNWPFDDSAAFVKFALFTGFRRGELFRLKWGDIDVERKILTLRAPKGGKTETIPLSHAALSAIEDLPRRSEYVFPGKNGEQRTDFKGPWLRIRKAAGLPATFRFHGLRHHFASTLVSNGVDLAVVGKLLSHKQAQTTARYSHLLPGALKSAATKSGELLKPKRKNDVLELKR